MSNDPYFDYIFALGTGQVIQHPLPYNVREALSTGSALAGIGVTASAAAALVRNGVPVPIVITPLR